MIGIDLRQLFNRVRQIPMMAERMVRIGHADFRINAAAAFSPAQSSKCASDRAKRGKLQIEHQRQIFVERGRNSGGLLDSR